MRATLLLPALTMLLAGCGASPLTRVPQDQVYGTGIAPVALSGGAEAQSQLSEALVLANAESTKKNAGPLAAQAEAAYRQILASAILDDETRGQINFDIALACFVRGDLDAALEAIERARAQSPSSPHIVALHDRIAGGIARRSHQEDLDAIVRNHDQVDAGFAKVSGQFDKDDAELVAVEASFKTLQDGQSNQLAVLDRAFGTYIPIKIPDDIEGKIQALEAQEKSANAWPLSEINLEAFVAGINQVIHEMPSWAEKDLLPRVNRLRWDAEAFKAVGTASRNAVTDNAAFAANIDDILNASPAGASEDLRTRLLTIKNLSETAAGNERRASLLARATDALAGEGDPSQAWVALEPLLTDDKVDKNQVEAMRHDLRAKVVTGQAIDQTRNLNADLTRMDQEPDWHLRQAGLQQILSAASSELLSLRAEGGIADDVITALRKVRTEAQTALDALASQRYMDYQKWALQQIQLCDASEKEAASKATMFHSLQSEDYQKIHDAMVANLVPIRTELLDPAVDVIYQRVFKACTDTLKDRDELTDVAKQAAVVKKKGLGDD